MKVAMVIPSRESEKAISSYATEIVNNVKKQGVDIESVFYEAGKPSSFFKLFKHLKKYDVIHLHHEYNLLGRYGLPFFPIFFLLGSMFRKKVLVTTMHTILSQKEKFKGNPFRNFLRKGLYIFQNRIIDWASDKIIVSMKSQKRILIKEYASSHKKISVYHSGGPTDAKHFSKKDSKKELNLSGSVYLIIGNLVPDHGAEKIINQADKIGKTILLVSSPNSVNDRNQKRLAEHLKYLRELVKEKGFEEYVRFDIRPLNDKMTLWWKYLSASDIVLQPYRKGIGSGIFLHSMATKTPVVSSNTEFFTEIKKDFDCLRIAKSKEDFPSEIKEAMKTKNYKKMQRGCENYLKENSWTKIAKRYKRLYLSELNR